MLRRLFFCMVIVSTLMNSGCFIKGKIVDESGSGVAGVTVSLSGDASMTAITDSDGTYRLGSFSDRLGAGSYTVTPSGAGCTFAPTSTGVTITTGVLGELGDVPLPKTDINFTCNNGSLLQPADFQYLGAFRLPGEEARPRSFEYGGEAMTFNPKGNASGPEDGFPGSLFVMGHQRIPVDVPNGNQVAEISIPLPVVSKKLNELNYAEFVQGFHDITGGSFFTGLDEIPRVGMQYLDVQATGAKVHITWGQHFDPEPTVPTHAWFDPDLSSPQMQGTWYIGNQSFYSTNDYLFEIPTSWADSNANGRYLATGRYRDGGWSGMGPALFAYRPWIDDNGTPASSGSHLEETVLLLYENSYDNDSIERCLSGYQHADEWTGGAWLTTGTGKSAVLFAGTKGTGAKYWYGFINPAGSEYPCVAQEFVGEFPVCRNADGTACPGTDLTECQGHNDSRGWWSSRFTAQFILYNPGDFAKVASGEMNSWEPQPYASLDIDERLLFQPPQWEDEMIGTGDQRRFRVGAVAYDRSNGLLYVLELFGDEAKPVVHVWDIQ